MTVRTKQDLKTPAAKAHYIGRHGYDAYSRLPAEVVDADQVIAEFEEHRDFLANAIRASLDALEPIRLGDQIIHLSGDGLHGLVMAYNHANEVIVTLERAKIAWESNDRSGPGVTTHA